MAEFEIGGVPYRSTRLTAKQQWGITRRMLPVLTGLRPLAIAWAQAELAAKEAEVEGASDEDKARAAREAERLSAAREHMLGELAQSLRGLSDEDSDYIIDMCMGVTSRNAGQGWTPIWNKAAKREQFEDITMGTMLTIVGSIIQQELASFFN